MGVCEGDCDAVMDALPDAEGVGERVAAADAVGVAVGDRVLVWESERVNAWVLVCDGVCVRLAERVPDGVGV